MVTEARKIIRVIDEEREGLALLYYYDKSNMDTEMYHRVMNALAYVSQEIIDAEVEFKERRKVLREKTKDFF